MVNNILISIVIPYKNTDVEKFRNLCLSIKNSIHNYNQNSIEIIFVNDKSSEKNADDLSFTFNDVFKDTEFNIDGITVPDSNVGGILQSRLLGIKTSKGKYIWTLDSDDQVSDTALDVLIRYINILAVDMLAWKLSEYSDKNESKYITQKTLDYTVPYYLQKETFQTAFYKTREISGYVHCKLIRREVAMKSLEELQNVGYINLGDDHLLCDYWIKDSDSVLLIPERPYDYLEPDCSSKVMNMEPKFQLSQLDSVKNVKKRYKEFFNKYSNDLSIELSDYDKHRMMILVSICRIPRKELCSQLIKELIEEFGLERLKEYSSNNNNVLDMYL